MATKKRRKIDYKKLDELLDELDWTFELINEDAGTLCDQLPNSAKNEMLETINENIYSLINLRNKIYK